MRRIESKPTHLHPQAQTVNRSHRHASVPIDARFFRPCRSLRGNDLGPAGAEHLSGALKINTTLKDLKCAASSQNLPTCTPRPRP